MNKKSSPAPPANTMFGLLHVARELEDRLEGALAEVQLNLTKLSVLSALVRRGEPLTLSDLAIQVSCVRSNMTQVVDRLEADGLVKRVADASDRRIVRAALTPLGGERQAAGAERLARVQSEFCASISPPDRAAIDRLVTVFQ